MNSGKHAKTQTLSAMKLGLILSLSVVVAPYEANCGQALGCNNLPPGTGPILDQLPADLDQRPRLDTSGNIVDAHDGMLVQFGDQFYLYGTAYGLTDGWRGSTTDYSQPTNHYRCYTSTDLVNWTLAADYLLKQRVNGVLVDPPAGLYFLPKVIYNALNNEYVMWYNWWNRAYGDTVYLGVAHSCSPTGPFEIYNHTAVWGSHDMSLLVDDNQQAYMMYTMFKESGWPNYVQPLSPDYLSLSGTRTYVTSGEGCVLFKNNAYGKYYALIGGACAFCPQGASSLVYESVNPLGPYQSAGDINPVVSGLHQIPAQQVNVAKVSTTQGDYYIWMGDLWGSGPKWTEQPPPVNWWGDRGEDQQYWANLVFNTNGHIQTLPSYVRTLVLVNNSQQPWYENAQLMAYPSDGTTAIQLGYRSTVWNPGEAWIMSLAPLAIDKYYTLELQDISNATAFPIASQNFINSAAFDGSTFCTGCRGGSISGYVYFQPGGGYFGWYAAWDGKPYNCTASMTLTNLGWPASSDPLRVVAYLNNAGPAIVVGWRTDTWNPGQTWTISLSALTAGACYTFEVQDPAWSNAVIPPRSSLFRVPSTGAVPGGSMYYDGQGGYWGWHMAWSGQPCTPPATLTLVNDSFLDSTDPLRIVAYLNNAGSPIVVGSRTGDWLPQRSWEVPLSALTSGASYTFELQDPAYGNAVIPPRSTPFTVPSSGALLRGYMHWDGLGGYWGWHTQWGW